MKLTIQTSPIENAPLFLCDERGRTIATVPKMPEYVEIARVLAAAFQLKEACESVVERFDAGQLDDVAECVEALDGIGGQQ